MQDSLNIAPKTMDEVVGFFYSSTTYERPCNLRTFFLKDPFFTQEVFKMLKKAKLDKIQPVDNSLCGLTIEYNGQFFVFIKDVNGLSEYCMLTAFHELTHVHTISVPTAVCDSTKTFNGYKFWREFIADYTALKCLLRIFDYEQEKVLQERFLRYQKTTDFYALSELIAAIVIYDANIADFIDDDKFRSIELCGCINELALVCKMSIGRRKVPFSVFESIYYSYKNLYI